VLTTAAVGAVRLGPVLCFFAIAYGLAGLGLAVIGLPHLNRESHQGSTSALAVFPVMVVGVGLAGVGLTAATGGRPALRELWARWQHPLRRRWYLVVLVPPISILAVLGLLQVFVSPLVALRVLIAWLYTNTGSIRLAQSLHASSTGCLVLLGAYGVSAGQEALWYACYAAVLWLVVGVVVALCGRTLMVRRRAATANQPNATTATITT